MFCICAVLLLTFLCSCWMLCEAVVSPEQHLTHFAFNFDGAYESESDVYIHLCCISVCCVCAFLTLTFL